MSAKLAALQRPIDFFRDLTSYSRTNYIEYLVSKNLTSGEEEFIEDDVLVLAVHHHWHAKKLQGCNFAVTLAGHMSAGVSEVNSHKDGVKPFGWNVQPYLTEADGNLSDDLLEIIEADNNVAIQDKDINSVSLLFPNITEFNGLANLLRSLEKINVFSIIENADDLIPGSDETPKMESIGLRVAIDQYEGQDVESFALGFGPIKHVGKTRRSPITEIVYMVKPKRLLPTIHENLSDNRSIVHLADHPFPVKAEEHLENVYKSLWPITERSKLGILTGKTYRLKDDIEEEKAKLKPYIKYSSKARCTFAIPSEIWSGN